MIFEARQQIARPADEVWRFLTEPALLKDWMPGIDDPHTDPEGPLGDHSQLIYTARGTARAADVVEFEPGRLVALRSRHGAFVATYAYAVEPGDPRGETTVVTLQADCVASGLSVMVVPLVRYMMKKADSNQLEELKKAVEGPMTKTPPAT